MKTVLPLCAAPFCIASCTTLPKGVEPVADFDLDAYLGKWCEVARPDHCFERGLQKLTAEHSLRGAARSKS